MSGSRQGFVASQGVRGWTMTITTCHWKSIFGWLLPFWEVGVGPTSGCKPLFIAGSSMTMLSSWKLRLSSFQLSSLSVTKNMMWDSTHLMTAIPFTTSTSSSLLSFVFPLCFCLVPFVAFSPIWPSSSSLVLQYHCLRTANHSPLKL